jgi:predicted MPP superfamily phosphohydrolase
LKYISKQVPGASAYSLSRRLGFALQKKLQMARADIGARLGDARFNPRQFEIVTIPVVMQNLDPAFHGYRVVQISDIHLGQWITADRLNGVVDLVNQQKPDLVAITGDFVSYVLDPLAEDLASGLEKLRPRDATVATLGNHDHWVGAESVRQLITQSNVRDLSNDVFTLHRDSAMLHIAGVDSVAVRQNRLDLVMSKLPSDGPAILLVHEPDFADVSAKTGRFSLQLSGHSHGGQIVIPGIGTPIRSYHFWKYPLGRYQVGSMVQYTNRGLGTNHLWSRINCPPEITVFDLEVCEEEAKEGIDERFKEGSKTNSQ